MGRLKKEFFKDDARIVAKELLGKILVRHYRGKEFRSRIVETEAYFGSSDPASWARFNGESKKTMEMDAGTILVKMVHNNWLFNIVTGEEGTASAVLIRAIEPLNFIGRGNGPGILTKELKINKKFNNKNIIYQRDLGIEDSNHGFDIASSNRIGVTKDLETYLRYYIKGNKYVSKKK